MVELASYLYHLNIQANLLSLNLESPNSLEMSEFLKEQYKRHLCDFNSMAEKVRSMDYLLPMCEKGLMGAFKNFKNVKTYEYRDSLVTYVKTLRTVALKRRTSTTRRVRLVLQTLKWQWLLLSVTYLDLREKLKRRFVRKRAPILLRKKRITRSEDRLGNRRRRRLGQKGRLR